MNKRLCLSSTHDKREATHQSQEPPFTPERQTRPDHHHNTSPQLVYVDRNHSYKYEGRKAEQTTSLPASLSQRR